MIATHMRKLILFYLLRCVFIGGFLVLIQTQAQTLYHPTARQSEALTKFLREYVKDPSYDYSKTEYYAAFVGLKDDHTQQVIVYFSDRYSCGSGGCTTLILTPKGASYKVVTSLTIVRLPICVLRRTSNGWHDISVGVQGGGIVERYQTRLSFNGKFYPSNPTVPPAKPITTDEPGTVVVPLTAESQPLFPQ